MIFTPLQPLKLESLDGSLLPMGTNRPTGCHQSSLIKEMKIANGENVSSIPGEDPALRPLIGFLYERVVDLIWMGVDYHEAFDQVWKEYWRVAKVDLDRGKVVNQIRTSCDGILGTPDGLDLEKGRIESYKFTWRSKRKWEEAAEEEFWPWLKSEAGYLYAINQTGWREGDKLHRAEAPIFTCRFFIFWANGGYSRKPGDGPQATYTDVTWGERELYENWQTLLTYKAYLESKSAEAH